MQIKHKSGFARTLTDAEREAVRTNSHDYVYAYGERQAYADSMASAKTAAEAEAAFDKRLRKMMEGSMDIREVTRTTNPIEVEARRLARVDIETWVRSGKVKKPTKEAFAEWVKTLAARPAYVEKATETVAARADVEPDADIMALLMGESDVPDEPTTESGEVPEPEAATEPEPAPAKRGKKAA